VAGSLAIDRFRIHALAPGDHRAADRLKALLGRIKRGQLSRRVAAALGDYGADDRRVIVLRRVDLTLAETRIDDADTLARQLAEGVAAAVSLVASRAPSESVAIFASAGARVAALVTALARGDAWGRWWFADFDGLRHLPVSSAIRAALLRDPVAGWEALCALESAELVRVTATLSTIDAELALEGLAPVLTEADDPEVWVEAFALPSIPVPALVQTRQASALLHDLAVLARDRPEPLPRSAIAALRLRALLASGEATLAEVAATIRAGAARRLAMLAPTAPLGDIARLVALAPQARARIAEALEAGLAVDKRAELPAPGYTRFGGILLLWPHLPAFDPEALPEGPGERAGLLALIALAALFGSAGSRDALADPVLRTAFGVDPRADTIALAEWLGSIPASAIPTPTISSRATGLPPAFRARTRQVRGTKALGLAAVADFARRLPGFAAASLPFLRLNLLGIGARVLVEEETVHAVLDRPPLDVLLGISGLADRSVLVGGGRRLDLERAR
jgi:hypothetical protein